MSTHHTPALASSDHLAAAAPTINRRLSARCAISLRPQAPSRLHITHGRAWVTLGLPPQGAGNASGDLFLAAGQSLAVPADAHLVMEPWQPDALGPVRFEWRVAGDARAVAHPGRFGREVVAPSRELAAALGQAGFALARLLRGLFGYRELLFAGRGRVLTRFWL